MGMHEFKNPNTEPEVLEKKIEDHQHWLNEDCENWQSMRAIFRGQFLNGIDLSHKDLRGVDFSETHLQNANLSSSNLCGANLYKANLAGANLSFANLEDADLSDAYLIGTNLEYARLSNADLTDAQGVPAMRCPEVGSFTAFTIVELFGKPYIAELFIPKDALRVSSTTPICRCSKAKTVMFYNINGQPTDICEAKSLMNNQHHTFMRGTVTTSMFDKDRWSTYSSGIAFVMSFAEAIKMHNPCGKCMVAVVP